MTDLRDQLQASLGDTYLIERELGGGGMSRVFVAEETSLGRKVVLKVLPHDMAAGVSVERFRREIQLAASLQHPHIVPLHSAGSADGVFYYTMPMVEGESLRARLARQGELPVDDAVRVLRDVTDALAHAHARGVVHRDIKPDNVLLSGHHALVTDFGIAKAVSEAAGAASITSMGVALGTPAYMAPEQATAEPNLDHRVDIYAVGVLAYEMLTGRTPFTRTSAQALLVAQVMDAPTPVREHRASVPAALADLIMRCLEKRPADRWQSAEELHKGLDAMATPSGGTTPTDPRPVKVVTAGPSRSVRYGIAAALVVLVGVAGFLASRGGDGGAAAELDENVVAVLPFRVAGADQSLHNLREGMMDLLFAKFTGEGGPRAADPRTVANALRGAGATETEDLSQQAAIDVAAGLGAGQLLLGGIVGSPRHVVLNVTLLGVPGGDTRTQVTVEGPLDSLPMLIDRLAGRVLVQGMGASPQTEASLTTTSFEALRSYLAGQAAYRQGDYQDAADHYTRAIDVDSTFALAAFALRVTLRWGGQGSPARAGRIAWAGRDRMSRRDQALMEAFMGPDYPEVSHEADVLAAREHAVTLAPDHPDAWYFLGDQYFHQGRYLGYTDWMARSEAGFKRAVALDPTFAGPVSHLVDLAVERGDTAAVRAFGDRLLATEGGHGGGYALLVRWEMAQALNDTALRQEVWASFDTMTWRPPQHLASVMLWRGRGGTPRDSDEFLGIQAQRASTRMERTVYLAFRMATLLDTGRPGQAAAAVDSLGRLAGTPTDQAAFKVLAALYWDGDNAAGAAAATRLAPVAVNAPAPDAERRGAQYRAACALGQWRVAHGALGSVPRLLARLRAVGRDRDGADIARDAELCATLLEGMLAVAQESPDARAAVDRVDSLMRRGPPQPQDFPFSQFRFSYENLAVARLYERLGAHREGMAAAQRGGFFGTKPSSYLRAEGRLAARVGEHDIARRAYAEFVRLWSDVEPALADEVEEVKAELARLTRVGG